MVRYSFTVGLFHPQLPAGLSRRFRTGYDFPCYAPAAAAFLGRPVRLGFSLRPNVFSNRVTNPSPPNGRPLAVARLSSAISARRRIYLSLLGSHCRRWKLTLLGYCLMPNHVHLVAVPEQGQSPAKAVGRTNCEYAVYSTDGGGAAGMFGKIVSIQQVCEGMSAVA